MRAVIYLVLILVVAGLLWIRFAPDDPARWNVDPTTVQTRSQGGWTVRPNGGNEPGRVWPWSPDETLGRIENIARAWPRTHLLVRDGLRETWETRTKWIGFPDYTTIEAVAEGGGTRLLISARQRYGSGDFGVNRTRVQAWEKSLTSEIGQADQKAKVAN